MLTQIFLFRTNSGWKPTKGPESITEAVVPLLLSDKPEDPPVSVTAVNLSNTRNHHQIPTYQILLQRNLTHHPHGTRRERELMDFT